MVSFGPVQRVRNAISRYRELGDRVEVMSREVAVIAERVDGLGLLLERTAELRSEMAALAERLDTIGQDTTLSRRAAQIAARHTGLRRYPTRAVFLIHNPAAWDSYGELVQLMRDSPDFEPVVVSIPHFFAGPGIASGETAVHDFLTAADVPHLRLRSDDASVAPAMIDALDPDLVFRQGQWDADVDTAFSPAALGGVRLCLIPYETMNPTHNVPWGDPPVNSAVDMTLHRQAWMVFVANDLALAVAREESLLHGLQFRALGHPKADALRRTEPRWPMESAHGERRRRILWSAHHSILSGWNDFGTFPDVCEDMLAWAAQAPDIDFVFTHHPLLLGTLHRPESALSFAGYEAWRARWDALPNTVATTDAAYAPLLKATDVLVTDGPSMMTEAQVTGTPVVFLERAEHIAFNPIGERLVRGVHAVPDVAHARVEASALLVGPDPLAHVQEQNVRELFGAPGAAERILDAIRVQIEIETGERRRTS
ncbi:hypothetical protein F6J84_11410 [Microbacterium caowuchunii]|uniref:hypothetical protein n=1 Tax=Microbacterium caowuchunii TaxID=2614638 RepID=UPI001248F70F|nr:hypothetical protein [Microbacterium caowuchunii]QEW00644.1 hypothetical protein F6J84_11410 [Microbacterium caowuchunii]